MSERDRIYTRRDMLRLTGFAAAAVVLEVACASTATPTKPVEIKPQFPAETKPVPEKSALEKKAETIGVIFSEVRGSKDLSSSQAISLTRATRANRADLPIIINEYNATVESGMLPTRAAEFVANSHVNNRPITESDLLMKKALSHPAISDNKDRAIDAIGLAKNEKDLEKILDIQRQMVNNDNIHPRDIPEVVFAGTIAVSQEKVMQAYEKTNQDGLLTIAVVMNERVLNGMNKPIPELGIQDANNSEAVVMMYNEFKDHQKLSEFSSKVLTIASVLNGHKLNEVVDAFNVIAKQHGRSESQETIAQLVLESVTAPDSSLPVSLDQTDEYYSFDPEWDDIDQVEAAIDEEDDDGVVRGGGGSTVIVNNSGNGGGAVGKTRLSPRAGGVSLQSPRLAPRTVSTTSRVSPVASRPGQGMSRPSMSGPKMGVGRGPSFGGGRGSAGG